MTAPDRSQSPAPSDATPSPDAVESRAHLLPEEEAAGSDDPERQAAAILEESEQRVLNGTVPGDVPERRHSEDTVPPVDRDAN